jgi:hypothetical protein
MQDKKSLIQKLKELFPGGRISCTEARKAAGELGVELIEMGQLCDEAGLKIYGCELGCF